MQAVIVVLIGHGRFPSSVATRKLHHAPSLFGSNLQKELRTNLTANDIETYSESDGSITIEPGDTATINGDVLATVDLEIYSSANLTITGFAESYTGSLDIETGNVEIDDVVNSATWIDINASNDSIMITGDVTANHSDGNNDILLQAQNNIQTGNIYDSGSAGNGLVEIDDNLAGGNTEFIIGGDGNTNGVNGSIYTTTDDGGGTDPDFIHGGVYITNGTSGSTGGITVTDGSNISVDATASRSGFIVSAQFFL